MIHAAGARLHAVAARRAKFRVTQATLVTYDNDVDVVELVAAPLGDVRKIVHQ